MSAPRRTLWSEGRASFAAERYILEILSKTAQNMEVFF